MSDDEIRKLRMLWDKSTVKDDCEGMSPDECTIEEAVVVINDLLDEIERCHAHLGGHDFTLECPFLGCDGEIDVVRDISDAVVCTGKMLSDKPLRFSFMLHSIICPACSNAVGHFEIGPSPWSAFDEEGGMIHRPDSGAFVRVRNGECLDEHLEEWARRKKDD